jgi:glycosyltransferase involved in cell wall biosynthesis
MSSQYPKISIITPNYNQGQYLEETILSVIGQNYPNLEYIIIDGGSTDNSVEIIKKYEKHLAYWVSEKDNGMYEAIQKGFDRSTGEIMAWINSDDKYHMGAFSIVAEVFSNFQEISWLTGIPTIWDKYGRCVKVNLSQLWSKYEMYAKHYLDKQNWIQQESTFWRRSLWKQSGARLDTSLKLAGDFELWLRFFRYAQLYTVEALLGGFRIHHKQLSIAQHKQYLEEANLALYREIENLPSENKNHFKILKRYKVLMSFISRINIHSFKEKYYNLCEYPPKVIYNANQQKFELYTTTYFRR